MSAVQSNEVSEALRLSVFVLLIVLFTSETAKVVVEINVDAINGVNNGGRDAGKTEVEADEAGVVAGVLAEQRQEFAIAGLRKEAAEYGGIGEIRCREHILRAELDTLRHLRFQGGDVPAGLSHKLAIKFEAHSLLGATLSGGGNNTTVTAAKVEDNVGWSDVSEAEHFVHSFGGGGYVRGQLPTEEVLQPAPQR